MWMNKQQYFSFFYWIIKAVKNRKQKSQLILQAKITKYHGVHEVCGNEIYNENNIKYVNNP